jgi:hypothetical protein
MKRHDSKPLQELQQEKVRGDGCWVASTPEKTSNEDDGVGKRRLLGDLVGPITMKWTDAPNQDFQVPFVQDAVSDQDSAWSNEVSRKRTADGAFVVRQDSVPRETPEVESGSESLEQTSEDEVKDLVEVEVEVEELSQSRADSPIGNQEETQNAMDDGNDFSTEASTAEDDQGLQGAGTEEETVNLQPAPSSSSVNFHMLEQDEEELDESDSEGSLEDFEEVDDDDTADLGQDFCTDSVLEPSQLDEDDEEHTTSFQQPTITLSLPRPEATNTQQSPVRALLQREAVAAMNLRAISFSPELPSPTPVEESDNGLNAEANPEEPQDDEETAHLLSFLHRVRSSRAARLANAEATTFLRASLSPARDDTDLSPISPGADVSSPSKVIIEQTTPTKPSLAESGSSSQNETAVTRRSKRARTPAKISTPAPGPPTSHIPFLHRRADGADTVILPKSAVQELAVITRTNTRRNRGDRNTTAQTIRNLDEEEETVIDTKASKSRRRKTVIWDETLVYFQTFEEEPLTEPAPEHRIKDRPKKAPRTRASAKPREKKPSIPPAAETDADKNITTIPTSLEAEKDKKPPPTKKSIPRTPRGALPKPKPASNTADESSLPRLRASPRVATKNPPKSRLPSSISSTTTLAAGVAKMAPKHKRAASTSASGTPGPKRRGSSRA